MSKSLDDLLGLKATAVTANAHRQLVGYMEDERLEDAASIHPCLALEILQAGSKIMEFELVTLCECFAEVWRHIEATAREYYPHGCPTDRPATLGVSQLLNLWFDVLKNPEVLACAKTLSNHGRVANHAIFTETLKELMERLGKGTPFLEQSRHFFLDVEDSER